MSKKMIRKKENGLNTWDEVRLFLEQDLTGDFISTADGKLLVCNSAYLDILGFQTMEEINNYGLYKLYPTPAERNKIVELLIQNNSLKNYEYQMLRRDGQTVFLVANIYGEFDNKGNLERIRGYMFNNTGHKKALDENRKLARAVEQSPAITLITDTSGNIEYVNQKFTTLTGYSREEVIGKNPRILKSGHTPPEGYKNLWETILSGKEWKGELLNRKKNGTLYWESAQISQIINQDGEITHFLALKQDITEQKKAELQHQVIFNISSAANTSPTLEELLDHIRKELGKMMDVRNFFVALYNKNNNQITLPYYSDEKFNIKSFPQGNTLTHYVIQSKKPLLGTRQELDKLTQKGVVKFAGEKAKTWMGVPLMVKGEAIGAFVIQNYDNENTYNNDDLDLVVYVSNKIGQSIERKKNEELLREALEKAQESDRLKSNFLAAMSHELRTPLNAVIGFSELIHNDSDAQQVEDYAKIIHNSGTHLLEIVETIFDITLIESGEIKLNNSEFRLRETIESLREIIRNWQQYNHKTAIKIHFLPLPELSGVTVIGDRNKLLQVLGHLLKNALKFTEEGHIEFGYFLQSKGNNSGIEFYVKDSGIGISPEAQKAIFEMFRQADDTYSRKYEGIGVGLTVAKRLVNLMGGNIWVESEQGKGSTFRFTIPYVPATENKSEKNEVFQTGNKLNFSGKTILIAEDEMSNFQLLKIILSSTGANILWAKNGKEAVELCTKNPHINLVLMDIKMPEMSGFEATMEIKKIFPHLPVIAQTAFTLNGDYQKARNAGCDDYIEKPIQKKKLFNILTKYINETQFNI